MALRGRTVLGRGAMDIHREFLAIRDRLTAPPRRICDIGCGLGHLDIFLAGAFEVDEILLVDIESSATHRHNFNREGSGYNSLASAGRFVRANVPATTRVATCNPRREDLAAHAAKGFDLVVSLLSCGYHYPTDEYVEFFRRGIAPGGILILDLRHNVPQNDLSGLFDVVGTIEETDRYRRTIFRRK
jgi:SAM-dependent methyltransferase